MSSAREIPGFYYDEERKKYFRVQPDHRAPDGAAHSKSAIKAKKEARAIEQIKQDRQTREKRGQIRRHDPASYTSLSLALRLGQRPRGLLEKLSQNYVSRFSRRSADLIDGRRLEAFTAAPNGRLYTMITAPDGRAPYLINHSTSLVAPQGMVPPMNYVERAWASMTSLADRYLLSTHGKSYGSFCQDTHRLTCPGSSLICIPLEDNEEYPFYIHNRYNELAITDIAASPDSSSLHIALATDNGLHIGKLPLSRPPPERCHTLRKEQVVVTFKDANIVMSGERSGAVNFTDVRIPSTVHRLQHSSAVNGIVTGRNTNHIIASGLGNIALYDLRYTKAINPKKRKKNETVEPSHPLIPFHVPRTHQTEYYTPGKNLTYIPNLDVALVACQRAAPNKGGVLLYNASTGQLIDSPISKTTFDNMRGVAVTRVRDGPESIFIGEARSLHEYTIDIDSAKRDSTDLQLWTASGMRVKMKEQDDAVSNLATQRFPLDANIEKAALWRKGDRGPS